MHNVIAHHPPTDAQPFLVSDLRGEKIQELQPWKRGRENFLARPPLYTEHDVV